MPTRCCAWCTKLAPETRLFTAALLAALAVSCAGSTQQQRVVVNGWDELQQRYPREQFLTAIGESTSLATAQQQALFNLGQNFSVQVTGVAKSNQVVTSIKTHGSESVTASATLNTSVRRHTDQLVQGAEIYPVGLVESNYRALAVLEKAKGRRILLSQLSEYEGQIENALHQARQLGKGRLESAGWLQRASNLAAVYSQRQHQLLVLGGASVPLEPNQAELRQQLAEHIRNLPFSLEFNNSVGDAQRTTITNALAKAGIRHKQKSADYQLIINLEQQPPLYQDDWYWMVAQLKITLAHNNVPHGELQWELKSAARQQGQVQSRLDKRITDTLNQEIIEQLIALAVDIS